MADFPNLPDIIARFTDKLGKLRDRGGWRNQALYHVF
jgi:hypothetical protein